MKKCNLHIVLRCCIGKSQLDSAGIENNIRSNATRIDALYEEQVGLGSDLAELTTELQSLSQEVSSVASSGSLNNRLTGLKDVASLKNSVWSHRTIQFVASAIGLGSSDAAGAHVESSNLNV